MDDELFLTREEINKGYLLKEGNDAYWSNRELVLFTTSTCFKSKCILEDKDLISKFENLNCKGYAFRGVDEEGTHYLGLFIDKSADYSFSYLCALIAHETRHITDYVMEDAAERLIYGLEIPAYIQEQMVFDIIELIDTDIFR